MSERIKNLKDIIEVMHNCTASHIASEPLTEVFRGEVAWNGVVETFDLDGHPNASRCHAWDCEENGETQVVTVLEMPPVTSAEMAVRVTVASRNQR